MNHSTNNGIISRYDLIIQERQINRELDLLHEDFSSLTNLPSVLQNYTTTALPSFIKSLGGFLSGELISGASGAAATYAFGKGLMLLSKKISKEADDNLELVKAMLPAETKKRIEAIEGLKVSDPEEYRKQVFLINKNTLKELRESLEKKGIKTNSGVIAKVLDYLGTFLSSTVGSIAGGVVVAALIYILGFNPLPSFPVLNQ